MNLPLSTAWYAFGSVASLWLVLLWLCSCHGKSRPLGTIAKTLAGIATVLLLFIPIEGVPLWNRAFSFYTNPSLPMLGIVCAALWQRLFGLVIFHRADWTAIWVFGAVAGSALYLHPIVFRALDLYYWGWDHTIAAWAVGSLAVLLLAAGNRLGMLVLASLIAFAFSALESRNCWDYVMDPIYWLTSLGVLTIRAALSRLRRSERFAHRHSAVLIPKFPPALGPQPATERAGPS